MDDLAIGFVASAKSPAITPRQMPWTEFVEGLATPDIRDAKDGRAYVLATFGTLYRNSANVLTVSAIGLDIDGGEGTPPPAAAHEFLADQGWRHAIVTTWGHTPMAPRYRVLIALDHPLDPAHLRTVHQAVQSAFPDEIGKAVDKACIGDRARLFYLPAVPPERAALFEHYRGDGMPLCSETLEALAQTIEDEREDARQRAVKPLQRRQWAGVGESVIEQFNRQYSAADVLEAGGYTKRGKKWLAPSSTSKMPGITVLDNKVYSHHASDTLNTGHCEDAFGCFAAIFHNGDQRAAAAAIRKEARHGNH